MPNLTPVQAEGSAGHSNLLNLPFSEFGSQSNKNFASSRPTVFRIDDYAKDGGEELFTKMHCVLIANP